MKQTLTSLFLLFTIATIAQPKVISQAVITTKTTITTPEGMEDVVPSPPPSTNGEEVRIMRFGGDGETKSVITLKGDLVKTYTETEMSRSTTIRDNSKKITTTLTEAMGNKNGFFATDEEMADMGKKMDSMMQSRRQNINNLTTYKPKSTSIVYTEETKKIAGLATKKAFLVTEYENGKKDTTATVWYCPDFKLKGITTIQSSGGMAAAFAGPSRITNLSGLSDLVGFPILIETKMGRGRKMTIEVTKINIEKEVADKEFEIPKDFVVKPIKDVMQGGSGDGRMMIRMGGPGGGN